MPPAVLLISAGRSVYASRPQLAKVACGGAVALFVTLVFGSEIVTPWVTKFGGMSRPLLLVNWPFLLVMILSVAPLFYGAGSHRLDNALGELSYPMYLCHMLVGGLIATWLPEQWQAGNGLYVATVILTAIALDGLIVKPIDGFRRRLGARAPTRDHRPWRARVSPCRVERIERFATVPAETL